MFRLMVENVEDYAIFMLDTEGRVVSWNVGAERIKGYSAEEIIDRHFSCFYPPEAIAEGLPRRLLQLADERGRATDEGWRVRKGGDRFWAGVTIAALHGDDGQLIGFAKVTRDLTERRAKARAEAELLAAEREAEANRRSAERFVFLSRASHTFASSLEFGATLARVAQAAVPKVADWCAVLLKSGESELRWVAFAHADPALHEATRFCLERFTPELSDEGGLSGVIRSGRPLLISTVTDAHLLAAAVDDEHLEALRAARIRSLMVVPLAIRETVLGALLFAASGSDRNFDAGDLSLAADYAERAALAIDNARWYERTHAAEVAMRSRTQMLQAVIQSSPLPIVVLDAKSVVIDYNRAGERAFGWRRNEVIGVNLAEAPAYVQALNERIERAGWGEVRNGTISSLRRKDGSPLDVSVSAAVIRGADGGVAGIVAIFEDVTARTRFLRVAAHELSNPLTSIDARLQLLTHTLPRETEAERALSARVTDLQRGVRDFTGLLKDVFDAVRLREAQLPLQRRPVDLVGLVEEAIGAFSHEERYALRFEAPAPQVGVMADAARLQQVLRNLLHNAIKYSPDGGEITVTLESDGERVRITVTDQGLGIPKDEQAQIFEGFYRASNIGGVRTPGLGLGLYICREIVAQHGGRIWVKSDPGAGAAFFVEVPAATLERALNVQTAND